MNNSIFMRSEKCPICGTITKQPHYKARTYILQKTDYDLYSHYKGINPLYYGAKLCNSCGYANFSNIFEKPKNTLKIMREEYNGVKKTWVPWNIPEENDIAYAIKLHKLVLMNYLNDKNILVGEVAYVCLKLYWLNKELGNTIERDRYRRLALDKFTRSYMEQVFPVCNILDQDTAVYLIAILYFEEGNVKECKKWLSLLIQNELISAKLKKRVTDFKLDMLK